MTSEQKYSKLVRDFVAIDFARVKYPDGAND
jgi:hypothetical protein